MSDKLAIVGYTLGFSLVGYAGARLFNFDIPECMIVMGGLGLSKGLVHQYKLQSESKVTIDDKGNQSVKVYGHSNNSDSNDLVKHVIFGAIAYKAIIPITIVGCGLGIVAIARHNM